MAVVDKWNPNTRVAPPGISGAGVTAAIAAAGKGFSRISEGLRREEALATEQELADAKIDMAREELDFKLGAPERELAQSQALFEQGVQQQAQKGKALSEILSGVGGSQYDRLVAETNMEEIMKDNAEWQLLSPEEKARQTELSFESLKGQKRLTSDAANVRRQLFERGSQTGYLKTPEEQAAFEERGMSGIFGKKAPKEVLTAMATAAAKGSGSTVQDKLMLEMVKQQGKKLDESNYRETMKFADEWMEDRGLNESRWKLFGLIDIPDVARKKVYRKNVRKLIGDGVSRGIPATGTIAALDAMMSDEHINKSGLDLMTMEDGSKTSNEFWTTARNAAGQQGGNTGQMMDAIAALSNRGGGGSSIPLSEILSGFEHQTATRGDVDQFLMQDFISRNPAAIMPAPAPQPNQAGAEADVAALVNGPLFAAAAAQGGPAAGGGPGGTTGPIMPQRSDFASGRAGARQFTAAKNDATRIFEASPAGQAIVVTDQIENIQSQLARAKRPAVRRRLAAELKQLQQELAQLGTAG